LIFDGVGDPPPGWRGAGVERVESDGKERGRVWWLNGDGRVWERRVVF
jgi:hypothetical protein